MHGDRKDELAGVGCKDDLSTVGARAQVGPIGCNGDLHALSTGKGAILGSDQEPRLRTAGLPGDFTSTQIAQDYRLDTVGGLVA